MGKPRIKKKKGSANINIKNIKKMFEMIPITKEQVANTAERKKDWLAVRITKGKFKNVIYKYGKIEIVESDEESEKTPVHFEYTILKNEVSEMAQGNPAFEKLLADILVALMDEVVSYKKYLEGIKQEEVARSNLINVT